MSRIQRLWLAIGGFSALTVGGFVSSGHAGERADVQLTTPSGITLVEVLDENMNLVNHRLGDASGKPLYSHQSNDESGASSCAADAECAREFPPVLAPRGAEGFGAWTLIPVDRKSRQWVYMGRPLHTYAGQAVSGEPSSDELPNVVNISAVKITAEREKFAVEKKEDVPSIDAGVVKPDVVESPKEGWKLALYRPQDVTPTPPGIQLRSLAIVNGYGFVVSSTGVVIYELEAEPRNPRLWMPVYAPGIAQPIGDFSIAVRKDGTRQWAYKQQPLYTYARDYAPGDAYGMFEQEGEARVALAFRHFMPDGVEIQAMPFRGPLMVNVKGMTLYTQSRQKIQYGGRQKRGGYRYTYASAKAVGTRGCVNDCLKEWRPVVAPRRAQSSGFWEVTARPDGSRQWTYRGSPLYTYVSDKKPGDIRGNNRHVIVYGDPTGGNMARMNLAGGNEVGLYGLYGAFGSGFYWSIAGLHN